MLPVHPQACPAEPDLLRWVVPAGVVPGGAPRRPAPEPAPALLAGLLADGTLAELCLDTDALLTRLGPGRSWPVDGPAVRAAVHAALADAEGWLGPAAAAGSTSDPAATAAAGDVALAAAARELLRGGTADLARSHGGLIELVDVRDGVVRVRLGGACDGCPASAVTLHLRLEGELRQRCPGVACRVEAVDGPDTGPRRRPWSVQGLWPRSGRRPPPGAAEPGAERCQDQSRVEQLGR